MQENKSKSSVDGVFSLKRIQYLNGIIDECFIKEIDSNEVHSFGVHTASDFGSAKQSDKRVDSGYDDSEISTSLRKNHIDQVFPEVNPRNNISYKQILNWICEEYNGSFHKMYFPFALEVEDIKTLVEKVWCSRSVFGTYKEKLLVLCKWNPKDTWCPWNCMLVYEDEANVHSKFKNPVEVYSKAFVQTVNYNNTIAKYYFPRLVNLLNQQ